MMKTAFGVAEVVFSLKDWESSAQGRGEADALG
jgi:hypothetical protein